MSVFYSVELFQKWRKTYSDWQELRTYLESEEGGYLQIVDESDTTCIIRYHKSSSRMELPHVRLCRSVVWDKINHYPLSIAPPKASVEKFPYASVNVKNITEQILTGQVAVEEHVDGFMIQVYQRRGESDIHITTRSRRDASGTFYSAKPFRTLFLEACEASGLKIGSEEWNEPDIADAVVRYWSFVVQHPEHHVVTPFSTPRAYLIHRGHIYPCAKVSIQNEALPLSLPSLQDTVKEMPFVDWISQYCQLQSWGFRGIVVKDTSGERWRFRSEKYAAIQSLRGSESNAYERYARIFTQNLSGVYFEYYPEDKLLFYLCGVYLNDTVHTLYRLYHLIYIRKTSSLPQVNRIYRQHLYAIHGIYLSTLRPANKWITVTDIRIYIMSQPPSRVAFLIRHHQE